MKNPLFYLFICVFEFLERSIVEFLTSGKVLVVFRSSSSQKRILLLIGLFIAQDHFGTAEKYIILPKKGLSSTITLSCLLEIAQVCHIMNV